MLLGLALVFATSPRILEENLVQLRAMFRPSTLSEQQLIQTLKSGSVLAKEDAAFAISELPKPSMLGIQALVDALDDPSYNVRDFAAVSLGRIGEPALPLVAQCLRKNTEASKWAKLVLATTNCPTSEFLKSNLDLAGTMVNRIHSNSWDQRLIEFATSKSNSSFKQFFQDILSGKVSTSEAVANCLKLVENPNTKDFDTLTFVLQSAPSEARQPILAAVHTTKSAIFQKRLLEALTPNELFAIVKEGDKSILNWIIGDESLQANLSLSLKDVLELLRSNDPLHRQLGKTIIGSQDGISLSGPNDRAEFRTWLSRGVSMTDAPLLSLALGNSFDIDVIRRGFLESARLNNNVSYELGLELYRLGETDPKILEQIAVQVAKNMPEDPINSGEICRLYLALAKKSPVLKNKLINYLKEDPDQTRACYRYVILRSFDIKVEDLLVSCLYAIDDNIEDLIAPLVMKDGQESVDAILALIDEEPNQAHFDFLLALSSKFPKAQAALGKFLHGTDLDIQDSTVNAYFKAGLVTPEVDTVAKNLIDKGHFEMSFDASKALGSKSLPYETRSALRFSNPSDNALTPWGIEALVKYGQSNADAMKAIEAVLSAPTNSWSANLNRARLAEALHDTPSSVTQRLIDIATLKLGQPEPAFTSTPGTKSTDQQPYHTPFLRVLEAAASQNPKALKAIILYSKSPQQSQRSMAAQSLGRIKPVNDAIKNALEAMLGDSSSLVREDAANALLSQSYDLNTLDEAFGAVAIEAGVRQTLSAQKEILGLIQQPKGIPETKRVVYGVIKPSQVQPSTAGAIQSSWAKFSDDHKLVTGLGVTDYEWSLATWNPNNPALGQQEHLLSLFEGVSALGKIAMGRTGPVRIEGYLRLGQATLDWAKLPSLYIAPGDYRYFLAANSRSEYQLTYEFERLPGGRVRQVFQSK